MSIAGDALNDAPGSLEDNAVLRTVEDLRGLSVDDASGIHVGELVGALAETETGLLRYLDLQLDTLDRHVLVPIGHARVLETERDGPSFRLRAALLEELEQIPPFPADAGHIDDPFERALLEAYGRTFHGERYYAHPSFDHNGVFAGDHPIVGDDLEPEAPLSRLSYMPGWRVAEGEADIRGWPMRLDGDDTTVEVRDLIVDHTARRARYVVIAPRGVDEARLLPVGYVHIERDRETACASGLTLDDVLDLPAYDGGGVSRDFEERLHAALRRRLAGERRYMLPDFRPH